MLKPALQLKLGQQLTMTPQLQQAIRLLQLPVLELQAQIQQALESNVMLEAEEEEISTVDTAELPTLNYEQRQEHVESAETRDSEPQVEAVDDGEWTDHQPAGPSETPWSGDGDRSEEFGNTRDETLQEHLL